MRGLLLVCVIAACGKPTPRPTDITTVPTNAPDAEVAAPDGGAVAPVAIGVWKVGPGDFPVPADADEGTQMLRSDVTFQVPRAREIHAQLLEKLKHDGFVLDGEQMVMGGYRMTIHKGTQPYFVSVTENGLTTLMTITVKTTTGP